MANAKVRSLTIRPIKSADLSFNLSGVLDFRNSVSAQLGARIAAFDSNQIYNLLETVVADGKFQFDGPQIRKKLVTDFKAALFAVRNHAVESTLLHAILRRQSAFLRRYKHATEIALNYEILYPKAPDPESTLGRLGALRQSAQERYQAIKTAYKRDGRDGVIKDTTTGTRGQSSSKSEGGSVSSAVSTSKATSTNVTESTASGEESSKSSQTGSGDATTKQRPLAYKTVDQSSTYRRLDPAPQVDTTKITSTDSKSVPVKFEGNDWVEVKETDVRFESQKTTSSNTATATASSTSKSTGKSETSGESDSNTESKTTSTSNGTSQNDFEQSSDTILTEYRHPSAENDMRWYQRELDLQDQRLSHTLFAMQVPYMKTLLENELAMLDQEVRQLQLNYVHSFLTSPIGGLVTAVFKDEGESVVAGEPVIRVEDDSEILLVGVINHRAPLVVGMVAKIKIKNPYENQGAVPPIELEGKLVAVRGHSADNDEWEVIIRANNTVIGDPVARRLPLNYSPQRESVELLLT